MRQQCIPKHELHTGVGGDRAVVEDAPRVEQTLDGREGFISIRNKRTFICTSPYLHKSFDWKRKRRRLGGNRAVVENAPGVDKALDERECLVVPRLVRRKTQRLADVPGTNFGTRRY